jgi:hypothetical protein
MLNKKLAVILFTLMCVCSAIGQDATGNASIESGSNNKVSGKQTTSSDESRFEAGVQFTSLMKRYDGDRNGFGGRFGYRVGTFNEGKYTITAEAEFNFLPGDVYVASIGRNGRVKQGLFGVKVGRKYEKFGVFGKVRPGFVNYSRGVPPPPPLLSINTTSTSGTGVSVSSFSRFDDNSKGRTNFATDVGGVLEFYPSKRIITRFDFGDTIVRQRPTTIEYLNFPITGTTPTLQRFIIPASTQHNFQFSAGVGFRF